jgi:hypothetical protein
MENCGGMPFLIARISSEFRTEFPRSDFPGFAARQARRFTATGGEAPGRE